MPVQVDGTATLIRSPHCAIEMAPAKSPEAGTFMVVAWAVSADANRKDRSRDRTVRYDKPNQGFKFLRVVLQQSPADALLHPQEAPDRRLLNLPTGVRGHQGN